jgi:uncharacterized protein
MSLFDALPPIKDGEWVPVVMLVTVITVYLIAYYGASRERFEKWLTGRRDAETAQAWSVYLERLSGALLMGIAPLLVVIYVMEGCPLGLGFRLPDHWIGSGAFVIIGALILIPLIALNSGSPDHQKRYPEVRYSRWTWGRWLANSGTWIVYLVAYEFFIRGFLLFTLTEHFGAWPGLLTMTAFYVAIHLPKGASEAIGCLPMGIIFGLSAILSESIFPAACLHAIISISNASFCIKRNPKLTFG